MEELLKLWKEIGGKNDDVMCEIIDLEEDRREIIIKIK
jgi:hypothetical protein